MPPKKLGRLLKDPDRAGPHPQEGAGGPRPRARAPRRQRLAPIPAELIAWYRSLGLVLLEGYAMSEDFAYSHLSTPRSSAPGYVGAPSPRGRGQAQREARSWSSRPGRWSATTSSPDLDAECFTEDGYFRTGDKGERSEDGLLKLTGRVKELFKTGKGKYVAPAPIENKLNEHPLIELSCVSGVGQPAAYALVQLAEEP
jgi:long-chain acyl-CoA synthetase